MAIEDDSEIMPGIENRVSNFCRFFQSAEVENTQLKAEVVRCLSSEGEGYLVAAKFNDVNDRFLMDILAMVNGPQQKEE